MSQIPELNAVKSGTRVRWLGVSLGSLSFCIAIAGSISVLAQAFTFAFLAHFLAAITGGIAGDIADRRRLGKHFFPWIMAFALPLFGGSAAYFLLETMKKPRSGRLLEEYAAYLNDAASYRESVPVAVRSAPTELLSLGDVLSNPASGVEQRIAVEYLTDMETQAALEILRKAAASADRETYFLAMTAMTQMEAKLLARLGELEDTIRQTGENNTKVELLLKTATAYIDFIYYQFAIGERRNEYLHRAESLLQRALKNPSTGSNEINEALILLGRIELELNKGDQAAAYFSKYIELNPTRNQGYLWRAEAWHSLGKYARLREDCEAASKIGGIPPNMLEVLRFWLPEESDEERVNP